MTLANMMHGLNYTKLMWATPLAMWCCLRSAGQEVQIESRAVPGLTYRSALAVDSSSLSCVALGPCLAACNISRLHITHAAFTQAFFSTDQLIATIAKGTAANGSQWEPMGANGSQWEPMAANGSQWEILRITA